MIDNLDIYDMVESRKLCVILPQRKTSLLLIFFKYRVLNNLVWAQTRLYFHKFEKGYMRVG